MKILLIFARRKIDLASLAPPTCCAADLKTDVVKIGRVRIANSVLWQVCVECFWVFRKKAFGENLVTAASRRAGDKDKEKKSSKHRKAKQF